MDYGVIVLHFRVKAAVPNRSFGLLPTECAAGLHLCLWIQSHWPGDGFASWGCWKELKTRWPNTQKFNLMALEARSPYSGCQHDPALSKSPMLSVPAAPACTCVTSLQPLWPRRKLMPGLFPSAAQDACLWVCSGQDLIMVDCSPPSGPVLTVCERTY